ncbi:MAG TPA: hypothetical protein DF715_05245 [Oceanicaulis sp.]|nr:hypothetical protein [Oceanicaulis sp.]
MPSQLSFACAVPVGAWHPFLPEALASLALQKAQLEIALLDASSDPRVAEAADLSGIAFAYRRHGPDAGQAAAIAEGWRETRGDVLFWLNADDRLLPGALGVVAKALEGRGQTPDVVYGGSDFIDRKGRVSGCHDQVADVSELLLRSNTISQPSCFARRDAVERAGGLDESLHFVMDWDLWLRLYGTGARFKRVDKTLSAVYMGDDTKTGLLNGRRLIEVFSLVSRNAGSWAAVKSTLSLAGHTLHRRWSRS